MLCNHIIIGFGKYMKKEEKKKLKMNRGKTVLLNVPLNQSMMCPCNFHRIEINSGGSLFHQPLVQVKLRHARAVTAQKKQ